MHVALICLSLLQVLVVTSAIQRKAARLEAALAGRYRLRCADADRLPAEAQRAADKARRVRLFPWFLLKKTPEKEKATFLFLVFSLLLYYKKKPKTIHQNNKYEFLL
jgi:hypothetical protein